MNDHCVFDYAQQPPRFRCLHCGDENLVVGPLPFSELVSRADEFVARHSRCRQEVAALLRERHGHSTTADWLEAIGSHQPES